MKQLETNYTFNASGKTITFLDRETVRNDRLYAIINATRGVVYYTIGDSTKIVTVATNVVTLNAGVSTSGHSDSDSLLIIYEDSEMLEAIESLRMSIHSLTRTIGMITTDTTGQLRAVLATIPNMGTLTTLTNQNQFGTYAAQDIVPSLMHLSADNLRKNITAI